ncbi:hypothetical protein FA09DRAFT_336934 [Tilletiopsis washingtonensis]|uniref:Asl1-like glycosyl hydrolase catalytic domain-containing protein n=1 Tax=Tilletiopsis washingtonensis TaxID=58919 RepID=A0A316ZII3_9BASI|nr:hypothetical protein FA09DRAFT_336934 [Tilletiopsis washingtonensis]PWO00104.1 hypothetical protein FA09DRAFT_336934 [Tilletiopsis washingtonensis]
MLFSKSLALAVALLASSVVASHNDIHAPAVARHAGSKRGSKCKAKTSANYVGHKKHKSSKKASGSASTDNKTAASSGAKQNNAKPPAGAPKNLKGKAGLCWPNGDSMKMSNFAIGDVSWYYTWHPAPSAGAGDMMFCSMLWGTKQIGDYQQHVISQPDSDANKDRCTMGPNEVQEPGQANMSPQATCDLMRKYQVPLKDNHGYYLMGPSTSSNPNGLNDWYPKFRKACPDVLDKLDAISLHWYDVKLSDFKKYIQDWVDAFDKDVWVTEYACQNFNGGAQCTKDEAWAFHQGAVEFMDAHPRVVGYSAFSTMQNLQGVAEVNRMSVGSQPNALFRLYAGLN